MQEDSQLIAADVSNREVVYLCSYALIMGWPMHFNLLPPEATYASMFLRVVRRVNVNQIKAGVYAGQALYCVDISPRPSMRTLSPRRQHVDKGLSELILGQSGKGI
jgi:hypothetical protein